MGIKFALSGQSLLDVEICNHSPFTICLGGEIKFVEGNCTNLFEAAKRCGVGNNQQSGQSASTISGGHTIRATSDRANANGSSGFSANGSSANGSSANGSSSNGSSTNGSNCSCGDPCKLGRMFLQRLDLGDTLPEKATISFRDHTYMTTTMVGDSQVGEKVRKLHGFHNQMWTRGESEKIKNLGTSHKYGSSGSNSSPSTPCASLPGTTSETRFRGTGTWRSRSTWPL